MGSIKRRVEIQHATTAPAQPSSPNQGTWSPRIGGSADRRIGQYRPEKGQRDRRAEERHCRRARGFGWLEACKPKALRYRSLHVPARLTHGARRRRLRVPDSWPWASAIAAVFANIAAIPPPTCPNSAPTVHVTFTLGHRHPGALGLALLLG